MDHIELLGGVLPGEGKDGKLSARVLRKEAGHIKHLAAQNHPAIALGVVLRNLQGTALYDTLQAVLQGVTFMGV